MASYKTISKSLELLEDEGFLKKARRGIYYLPKYNKTLGIECAPNLNDVAMAIARQYNWEIIPSGNYALNIIGISNQVPSKIVYISNGPYREYDVGGNKIIFKHSTTREVGTLRKRNLIAIQAIRELGKYEIDEHQMKLINAFLENEDKNEILNGIRTTAWIYETLKRIVCIQ